MLKKEKKYIFIGMAWPYANGSLHLGHIAALLPADILARFHRLKGNKVLFVSGSDCHGTPISLKAKKEKISPEKIVEKYHQEFLDNFKKLSFSFDYYGKTTALEHKKIVQKIFLELYQKGYIYKKEQTLFYCPLCRQFLADRYIEGRCPKCGYEQARGNQCEKCGALLNPEELINPRCKLCGTKPIKKKTEHFFLRLSFFEKGLKRWLQEKKTWRPNALNYTKQFLKQGLKDRAITRDIDWGVEIPLKGYKKKRIYVWFEAVCGYFTHSLIWAKRVKNKDIWKKWWKNENAWHYYIHGKDNIPFHTIIWPSILLGLLLHLPDQIVSSEYLTIEGEKLSTSKNKAIWLPDYLKNYHPDALRYYLTVNGPETHDADFSWQNFIQRNNNELVATYGNLVNRFIKFSLNNFSGKIKNNLPIEKEVENKIKNTFKDSGKLIEDAHLRQAIKNIFELAIFGNQYLNKKAPWLKIKENKRSVEITLYNLLQIIYALAILLYPFLPESSEKVLKSLGVDKKKIKWEYKKFNLTNKLKKIDILFPKLR